MPGSCRASVNAHSIIDTGWCLSWQPRQEARTLAKSDAALLETRCAARPSHRHACTPTRRALATARAPKACSHRAHEAAPLPALSPRRADAALRAGEASKWRMAPPSTCIRADSCSICCYRSGQLLRESAPSPARVARRGRAATVRRRRPTRCGLWHGSTSGRQRP